MIVGCPVAHRGWIIRQWADAALVSCKKAGVSPTFLLAAHPDDPTAGVLAAHLGAPVEVVPVDVERDVDARQWRLARYEQMAGIRTALLRRVRELAPPVFLSVDSDILLHPDAVEWALPALETYDAVGSACFLSKAPRVRPDGQMGRASYRSPNYGHLHANKLVHGAWQPGLTRGAGVLMALKVMGPAAYGVDYRAHPHGEDAGWAAACQEAQLRFAWQSHVVSKHVMVSHCGAHDRHHAECAACVEPIGRVDPRCGF